MKTLLKTTLLLTALVSVPLFATAAATDSSAATQVAPKPSHKAALRRALIRHHLARKLGLSTDQVAQLKAQRTSTVAAIKAIRNDATLTADQKKAKVRETLKTARTSLRKVLTPEQQAKFDALRAKSPHHRNG